MLSKVTRHLVVGISLQQRSLYISSVKCKKKDRFHNKFISQNRPRIYSGFVEPLLEKTERNWINNIDGVEPDYTQVIFNEARRRRNIYRRKRLAREFENKKTNLHAFTADQIQHIKFLNAEDPELWTVSHLALSFGVDYDTMRAALRSKIPTSTGDSNDTDVNKYRLKTSLLQDPELVKSILPSTEVVQPLQPSQDEEIYNNAWFQSFGQSTESHESVELISTDEMDDLIEEEAEMDEHFELFQNEDDDDVDVEYDDLESESNEDYADFSENEEVDEQSNDNHDNDFKVESKDNNNFYDNEGRFLYKLR